MSFCYSVLLSNAYFVIGLEEAKSIQKFTFASVRAIEFNERIFQEGSVFAKEKYLSLKLINCTPAHMW